MLLSLFPLLIYWQWLLKVHLKNRSLIGSGRKGRGRKLRTCKLACLREEYIYDRVGTGRCSISRETRVGLGKLMRIFLWRICICAHVWIWLCLWCRHILYFQIKLFGLWLVDWFVYFEEALVSDCDIYYSERNSVQLIQLDHIDRRGLELYSLKTDVPVGGCNGFVYVYDTRSIVRPFIFYCLFNEPPGFNMFVGDKIKNKISKSGFIF